MLKAVSERMGEAQLGRPAMIRLPPRRRRMPTENCQTHRMLLISGSRLIVGFGFRCLEVWLDGARADGRVSGVMGLRDKDKGVWGFFPGIAFGV